MLERGEGALGWGLRGRHCSLCRKALDSIVHNYLVIYLWEKFPSKLAHFLQREVLYPLYIVFFWKCRNRGLWFVYAHLVPHDAILSLPEAK